MPGIEIPISGDLAGLQASIREMSAIFKQMAATVQAAMAPVQQVARQTAASMVQISTGATQAGTGMRGMVGAASSAGAAVANIAAGAKGLRSAFHFLRGLPAGWKSVAAAVAGAGAAVMGMVVAVRVVKSALSGLLGVARGVWNGIASGAAGAARSVKGVFSGVASAVPGGSLLGPLAGIAGIAGGVALVTSQLMGAFKAAAAFEDLEVRVSSFLGSTQAAAALLAELSTFADKTKFMTTDVQNAAGSLLGSGIRENISGIVQDIAAVSRDGEDLRSLADAVGKGFARGKFQTEALDAFMTRQINLMPALAKVTGLTGEALRDAIEEGLGFETVTAAIRALSQEGGQFFGVLERGGQTAAAKVSTLIGVWNTLRRTFAQPILDAIKPILSDAIGLVESFKTAAANAGKSVGQAVLAAFALVKSGQTMKLLGAGFDFAVAGAIDMLMRGLKAAGAFLSTVLPPIFEAAVAKLRDPMFWEGMAAVFRGIGGTIAIALQSAIADLEESLGKTKAARQRRELVAHDKERVEQDFFMGSQAIKNSGNVDMGKLFKQLLIEGGLAAEKQLTAPASTDLVDARDALRALLQTVRAEVEKMRAENAVPPPAKGTTGESNNAPLASLIGAVKSAMTLTNDLGRVGGSRFGMTFLPMVSEAKRGNGLLQKIEANTRNRGPMPAIA